MWILFHGALAAAGPQRDHQWEPEVTQIEIDSAAGNVTLRAGGDRIEVVATPKKDGPKCSLAFKTDGGMAKIEHRALKSGAPCQVDLVINLPSSTKVGLVLGAGGVELEGLAGVVDLEIGAGNVSGSAGGHVAIQLGAGNVELALSGPTKTSVGTGDIQLDYARAPRGRIESAIGVGSIQVALPAGAPVQWDGRASKSSHPVDPAAPTILDLTVGLGSVEVVAL